MFTSLHLFISIFASLGTLEDDWFLRRVFWAEHLVFDVVGWTRLRWETTSIRRNPGQKNACFHLLHAWSFAIFLQYAAVAAVCISNPGVYFWLWGRLLQYVVVKLSAGTLLDAERRIKEKMDLIFLVINVPNTSSCEDCATNDPKVTDRLQLLDNLIQRSEHEPRLDQIQTKTIDYNLLKW